MAKKDIRNEFITNEEGNPSGGTSDSVGISIQWQNGPLAVTENGLEQNGAIVEDLILIAIDRINFYNNSKFRCRENSLAVTKLEEAVQWLHSRLNRREEEGTENSYSTGPSEG